MVGMTVSEMVEKMGVQKDDMRVVKLADQTAERSVELLAEYSA